MSNTYTLTSVKGSRTIIGDLQQALRAATKMEAELQPAYGVTVSRDDTTIAEVHDGEAEMSSSGVVATLIEYMPQYLRESHRQAGNSGIYPHNGARRTWVAGLIDADELDDWARVVVHADTMPAGEDVLDDIPTDALAVIEG